MERIPEPHVSRYAVPVEPLRPTHARRGHERRGERCRRRVRLGPVRVADDCGARYRRCRDRVVDDERAVLDQSTRHHELPMRLAGRLLVVALLAATWWGITHSPMVAACTLGIGAMRVIQER